MIHHDTVRHHKISHHATCLYTALQSVMQSFYLSKSDHHTNVDDNASTTILKIPPLRSILLYPILFYSVISHPFLPSISSHLIQSNLMPSHLSTYRCWPLLIIRSSRPPHPLPWSRTSATTSSYVSTQAMGEACT